MKVDKQTVEEIAGQLRAVELRPLSESPLVSVLVANYNYAKYIGEAIDSVLCQTYQNFEVIVCDDGSKDNSREMVAAYAERDLRVKLIAKENGGIASALNAAHAASKGEIVCLLDADDIYYPTKLERVVLAFKSSAQSGVCLHRILKMYSDGRAFNCPVPVVLAQGWLGPEALRGGGIPKNLPSRILPEASGMSFRRTVTEQIFPLPVRFRSMADGYLCYAALFVTLFCAVPEVLARLRVHGQNANSAGEYTLAGVTANTRGMESFVGGVREFLSSRYGEAVASRLRVEDNSLYCSGRLLMHILGNGESSKCASEQLREWVDGIQPRRQQILARFLLLLPRSVSRRVLQFWRGLTPADAAMLRFTRFLLRI